jgi:hypothetical protein
MFEGLLSPWHLMLLCSGFFIVVPFWQICAKAGFPGVCSLLLFVPLVNLVFLWWLAFADWPALRRRREEGAGGAFRGCATDR